MESVRTCTTFEFSVVARVAFLSGPARGSRSIHDVSFERTLFLRVGSCEHGLESVIARGNRSLTMPERIVCSSPCAYLDVEGQESGAPNRSFCIVPLRLKWSCPVN